MGKSVYIAEKPSVAQEFAKALKLKTRRGDGFLESDEAIVTWCVGHLVTMSYPEAYDASLKKWNLDTLPFLPQDFKYEVIPGVEKQFRIVSNILNREDVDCIYVCTDSGREGEYIYRLVEQEAHVEGKERKRVWIDSQTEEEILRGIKEAKDLSEYDNLSASAYLRAKEDYLMGINFSRLLTLKYGNSISNYLHTKYAVVSVGRVMTCVLGMVVRREREIRDFVKTPFYRVLSTIDVSGQTFEGEWRAIKGSRYFESFDLYKENGFKERKKAEELISYLKEKQPMECEIVSIEKKKEKKNPPLLYNLAELQNDCSKRFKISPDETLRIVQELYEKKLVTYPRTDARVLSTAVAKEIGHNLNGLMKYPMAVPYLQEIVKFGTHKGRASKEELQTYEEERRLFYVGVTRAKQQLTLFTTNRESSFCREILGKTFIQKNSTKVVSANKIFSQANPYAQNTRSRMKPTTAEEYKKFKEQLGAGVLVKHKKFGDGVVASMDEERVQILFGKKLRNLDMRMLIQGGFLEVH